MYTELASGHTAQGRSHLEDQATKNGWFQEPCGLTTINGDLMMIQWFNNRLTMVNDVGYTWTFLLLPWPILDTLQKMTTSSLVKVDNPIDTD
jgi:hypothetical protein